MDKDDILVEGCKAGNQLAQIGVCRKYCSAEMESKLLLLIIVF